MPQPLSRRYGIYGIIKIGTGAVLSRVPNHVGHEALLQNGGFYASCMA